ncbi:SDR family oxidoreductase [Thermoanaerobacterium butyriciformans]|uniref:NAD(P)-dependent dehydrogenase (Short-subunit alcohol dehydrogenase family) n=1 Tax=Thermoanaerobacterium butyriciformans TaxID=1702242 RepID=A0ABS4NCN8_9THEO|nr:SDR family oxidoreductase [Thermoanaerobacterium butyriciformans]MBP2071448.1 NAD(P)-dependent dehydrogenase (short-subunit alcohol dehydrogenase family) [Thermoanaerobacterium butyriciformans]
MNILITGANRGLGRHLVEKALLNNHKVYAGIRKINDVASELKALKDRYEKKMNLIELDVSDEESIKRAAIHVSKEEDSLDVIVNNAGILKGRGKEIEDLDYTDLEDTLKINLMGPMMVVKYFLPLLKKGRDKVIINISSEAGSFANAYGGDYPYAVSKAALNFFTAQLKDAMKDYKGRVYAVHPGWMKTDMGGTSAPLSPEISAEGIMKIIEGDIKVDANQFFIDFKGQPMKL